MLSHEGSERSTAHDRRLAAYLAGVAGFVNSAGFVTIGSFTSHVTGNVGRFANDLVSRDPTMILAASMVAAFFAGAFFASMAIESNLAGHRPTTYGALLLVEALLLAVFGAIAYACDADGAHVHDAEAALLCFAMGLQNSLVTRASGAVVRTTHLTGVVTDLGIESARWFRAWRARVGARAGVRLVAGRNEGIAPQGPKTWLLLTIFTMFVTGSAVGAALATTLGRIAIAVPFAALVVGGTVSLSRPRAVAS